MQSTPVEIDTELARHYAAAQAARSKITSLLNQAKQQAGARYYYRGRQRVTDMSAQKAEEFLALTLDIHADDEYGYTRIGTSSVASMRSTVAGLSEARHALRAARRAYEALEDQYTGWSRFFLVTSSNGHIHSSMHCSTCRATTTFGWLPELSGKDMTSAIEHFGPAAECLCSVCFPDAPVARDQNLTQAQTDALLRGETPQAKPASDSCPGSGQQAQDADFSYYQPRGRCPHCKASITPTSTGKVRKHKAAK